MADVDLHARASELFLKLRDLPDDQRNQALNEESGGDTALRTEVASLLAYHTPPAQSSSSTTVGDDFSFNFAPPPEQIGPYRILRPIGRGGSGQVYLAEQSEPIHRTVAIKIVPQAAINPELAARFEVERRALERTDHPNIARVIDAGHTTDGMPYLVMNFIEGVLLTDYCEREALNLRDRIGLMLDVAEAIQHAHQRGIIHRDLKPANILVSQQDGEPTPIVLDFGIAKPLADLFTMQSPQTLGGLLGTPSYMAPEQTGGEDVDIRADVYALGAVLYELTCGRPPIEHTSDAVEMLTRIREHIPPPAGRIQRESETLTDHETVSATFLHDLDCILGRALEKSPDRRYANVAGFADDLNRLLRFEPIEARRPTLRYRAARFAQRNRGLVTASVAIGVTLLIGIVGLSWGLIESNRQERIAALEAEKQHEIITFFTDDLLASTSPYELGKDATIHELLVRAREKAKDRLTGHPLIDASIYHTLGHAFVTLGEYEDAKAELDNALRLRRTHAGPNAPDTIRTEIALASLLAETAVKNETPEALNRAEAKLVNVLKRARATLGTNDPDLYSALNDLGLVRMNLNKTEEAIDLLKQALAGRRRLLGGNHFQVFVTLSNLAYAVERNGDILKSLEIMDEVLRIANAQPVPSPMILCVLNNNIGATYLDLNRYEQAQPYIREAVNIAETSLRPDHPAAITSAGNQASVQRYLGNLELALELFEDVIARCEKAYGPRSYKTLNTRQNYYGTISQAGRYQEAAAELKTLLTDVIDSLGEENQLSAQVRVSLADALVKAGRPREALPHVERAIQQFNELYGPDYHRTENAENIVKQIQAELESESSR